MKYLLALVMIPIATLFASSNKPIDKEKCSCEGIPLYGNVKVVDAFPDMNIKVVDYYSTRCGEWHFVDAGEDFSIQFVDYFEDFSIRYDESFPGTN